MPDESVTLVFDPLTLPTVQHRAGLAGLVVVSDLMRRSRMEAPAVEPGEDGRWRVTLTPATLVSLMNYVYDAGMEEVSRKKGGRKKVADSEDATASERIVPRADFLKQLQMPDPWIKLWRDAVLGTLRPRDKQRIPYKDRCQGRDVGMAAQMWTAIRRFAKDLDRGVFRTEKVAGTILIGAMEHNAELVDFDGRVDENFLLHFWPPVTLVFQPEEVDRDGNSRFTGYVFAVPDVSNIEGFAGSFPAVVASLKPDLAGFRPRDSIITVPHEGALEYGRHLAAVAAARAGSADIAFDVAGFELHHLEKRGNNIHVHSSDRVGVSRLVLDRYEAIRGTCRDHRFRRQRILNLLRGRPWFDGFERVFATAPLGAFVGPKGRQFAADAGRRLLEISQTGGAHVGDQNAG